MSEAARLPRHSLQEYVVLEEMSNVRHEFLDGHIYAMAGGSPEHGGICANVIASLANALTGRAGRVFTSDVRVRVQAAGLDTYPDASVVCGRVETDEADRNAITNPVVLVEVTSPSTEAWDRGEKLDHYKKIPSLKEVLVVAHGEQRVQILRREPQGWSVHAFGSGGTIRIESLGCDLSVDDVYRDPLRT